MNESIDRKLGIKPNDTDNFDLGLKSINIYDYFDGGVKTQDNHVLRVKKLELSQKMKGKLAPLPKLEDFMPTNVIEDF